MRKTFKGEFTQLPANGVLVGGTNPQGRHGKGIALLMRENFGYPYGVAEGWVGRAYGIITKELRSGYPAITKEQITKGVKGLYDVAFDNPTFDFYVPYTSKPSLNYFTPLQMAEMFGHTWIPDNIVFEESFILLEPLKHPMEVKLQLQAKHFKGSNWQDHADCPMARAAREYFKCKTVLEGLTTLSIYDQEIHHMRQTEFRPLAQYMHDHYSPLMAEDDAKIAEGQKPDVVIRTIILTKVS